MPSGRDVHPTKLFVPPKLDEDTLSQMRAPADTTKAERMMGDDDDDSSSNEDDNKGESKLPGAFPGSSAGVSHDNPYY